MLGKIFGKFTIPYNFIKGLTKTICDITHLTKKPFYNFYTQKNNKQNMFMHMPNAYIIFNSINYVATKNYCHSPFLAFLLDNFMNLSVYFHHSTGKITFCMVQYIHMCVNCTFQLQRYKVHDKTAIPQAKLYRVPLKQHGVGNRNRLQHGICR